MPHRFARRQLLAFVVIAIAVLSSPLSLVAQEEVGPTTNGSKLIQGDDQPAVKQEIDGDAVDAAADADLPLEPPKEIIELAKKAKDKFLAIRAELAETLIDMRTTHTNYVNDDEQTPQAKELYREQRTKARRLMDKLFDAGLEVVRLVPDKEAATFLITWIQHRMNHSLYDATTHEAGARLLDGGFQLVYLFKATARSATIVGDFEMAKRLYKTLEEKHLDDLDKGFIVNGKNLEAQFKKESEQRKIDAEKDTNPRVRINTSRGDVVIELYIDQAPSTVANFIQLVESNFYDGLDFYQVIDDLLALTGDESGDGLGNTGKFLVDECNREDARMPLAGSLVMAKRPIDNKGNFLENSASCQFAILYVPIARIAGQQVVFGRVIEGMDSIGALRRVDPSKEKKKGAVQFPSDVILSMEVIRRPDVLPEINYFDLSKLNPHAGHDHATGPSQ